MCEAVTLEMARRALIDETCISGALVDVYLPDGLGYDFVREARAMYPGLAIMVATAALEHSLANDAQRLGVEFVFKPIAVENLFSFLGRIGPRRREAPAGIAGFASSFGLSAGESDVLALASKGLSRKEIAVVLDRSEQTVKCHIRGVLVKTKHPSMKSLLEAIRAEGATRRR